MQHADLAVIEAVLDDLGIEHGSLGEWTRSHHWATTDGQRVFVKVAETPDNITQLRNEVRNVSLVHEYGISTPAALRDQTVGLWFADNRLVELAVFEFLPSIPKPSLVEIGKVCIDVIDGLRKVPVPASAAISEFDWSVFHRGGIRKLSGLNSPEANELREAVVKWNDLLAKHTHDRFGLSHGDLHHGNVMTTPSGLVVVDWESAMLGPIEVDLAQSIRTCGDPNDETLSCGAYRHLRDYAETKSWAGAVDWLAVEWLARLRAASGTAGFLGRPNAVNGTPREWALLRGVREGHLFD